MDLTESIAPKSDRIGMQLRPAIDRFWEKVDGTADAEDCWEWLGGLNGAGYGQFYIGRTARGETGKGYAHRFAYETVVGAIPDGMVLDHLCRNRACVNPSHLEPVTNRENLLRGDGPSAHHAVKTHCPAGHPYAGDNLYVNPSNGQRQCRECGRKRASEKRQMRSRVHGSV